jgi:hypothetical protein
LPYDPFPPGEETSTRIDWRVRVERVVDRRLSYHKTCRCPEVPAIITAPPPLKVIPKGLFTAEFIARLMIEKYVLGRPLHRIGAAMHMEGGFGSGSGHPGRGIPAGFCFAESSV